MKKIAVVVTLGVAVCFVLASLAQATDTADGRKWANRNLKNKNKATSIAIWQITQDGPPPSARSVDWVDHAPNPRFAIYDAGTPQDTYDDLVLDKETGLVWERRPGKWVGYWDAIIATGYDYHFGGRKGWRVPTVEELASLVDPTQGPPTLPNGHPFLGVDTGARYCTCSTDVRLITDTWCVSFATGAIAAMSKEWTCFGWFVRGGYGHDAY